MYELTNFLHKLQDDILIALNDSERQYVGHLEKMLLSSAKEIFQRQLGQERDACARRCEGS